MIKCTVCSCSKKTTLPRGLQYAHLHQPTLCFYPLQKAENEIKEWNRWLHLAQIKRMSVREGMTSDWKTEQTKKFRKWRTRALSRTGSHNCWGWTWVVCDNGLCGPQNFTKQHSYITMVVQTHRGSGKQNKTGSFIILQTKSKLSLCYKHSTSICFLSICCHVIIKEKGL